jgi:hypothetical protein
VSLLLPSTGLSTFRLCSCSIFSKSENAIIAEFHEPSFQVLLDEQILCGEDTHGFCLGLSWSCRSPNSSDYSIPLEYLLTVSTHRAGGGVKVCGCASSASVFSEFPFIFFFFSLEQLDLQFLPGLPMLLGNSIYCLTFLCIFSRNKDLPSLLCLLSLSGLYNWW